RVRVALKDWSGALQDLDAFLEKPVDYHSLSAACLLRGFVLEQTGAPPEEVKTGDYYDPIRGLMGMPMLHNWIMASFVDELSDADAEQLLAGLMSFAGKDNPVF